MCLNSPSETLHFIKISIPNPMNLVSLLRSCIHKKSILKGKTVHARIILLGLNTDVYTNNHLLSMYLKLNHVDYALKVFDEMGNRNIISWTTLISSYSQMGLAENALDCFRSMVLDGFNPNNYTYVAAISACSNLEAIRTGKELHGRIYRTEEVFNSFVSNCLVNFYGKRGLLSSARLVFDAILEPNLVTWASLMSCYCQSGDFRGGIEIFLRSLRFGAEISEFICASVLGACTALESLEIGKQVHCLSFKAGVLGDEFVVTALVNFYAKCRELQGAHQAFIEVDKPHLSAWTALLGGYVDVGKKKVAVELFCRMLSSGLEPSEKTFASVIGAFTGGVEIQVGRQIHSLVIKRGFNSFTFVCNAILDFYMKSGHHDESLKAFHEMDQHDIVSWNTVIAGCVGSNHYEEATEFVRNMLYTGFEPNLYTYSSILSICGDLPSIEWGKQTHTRILKPGFDSNVVVGSALIDMYAKCGCLGVARKVFDMLPLKNMVSWNTMLVGYAQHGFGKQALEIYDIMRSNGVQPNYITFIGILSACGHAGLLEEGLHHFNSMTRDYGIIPRTEHLSCIVSLFARKGQTREAYDIIESFPGEADNVVWRCLLSGCKTNRDLPLAKHAAERILSCDPDDISAHVMLSNIYAELRMWDELAEIRKLMKEKEIKKNTGCSWTELDNKIHSFSASHSLNLKGTDMHEALDGLTAQLSDEIYVPHLMFSGSLHT